jgi:hypothetical protein
MICEEDVLALIPEGFDAGFDFAARPEGAEVDAKFTLFVSKENVLLNGSVVACLWDGMSSRSVLSEVCARRLGLDIHEEAKFIRFNFAATGASVSEPKRSAVVHVKLLGDDGNLFVIFDLVVLVSRHLDRFEAILGQDAHAFLSRKHFLRLDFDQPRIFLERVGPKKERMILSVGEGTAPAGEAIFTLQITNADTMQVPGEPMDVAEDEEMAALESMIRAEFSDVFAPIETGDDRAQLPDVFRIEFNELGPPPLHYPRRITFGALESVWLEKRLKVLEDGGIIERTTEPLALSPFFVTPKSGHTPENPKFREILDSRELNRRTVPMQFHTPMIGDLLQRAARSHIFSNLDLSEAFWFVPVHPDTQPYLCFLDHKGRIYKFKRMAFGLKNAPATFDLAIRKVLAAAPASIDRYVDDNLCHTLTLDQHMTDLRALCTLLRAHSLRVNTKSLMFKLTIQYLGHEVSHNSIKPILDTATLANWPQPTSITALRSVLGLANHYKKHIPNLGLICAPLFELLRKGERFHFAPRHVAAFRALIDALTSPVALYPVSLDPATATRLYTDASEIGAGAHVEQFVDGAWRAVGYATRLFNDAQRHYSAIVREALGVVFALKHFRSALSYHALEVYVDSKPLVDALNKNEIIDPRWRRVHAELLQFNVARIVHIEGEHNLVADMCSRPSLDQDLPAELVHHEWRPEHVAVYATDAILEPLVDNTWHVAYREDPATHSIMTSLKSGDANAEYFHRKYIFVDGLLFLVDPLKRTRLVVPRTKRLRTISHFHDDATAGHMGSERMLLKMAEIVYMPHMHNDVKEYVRSCESCARSKPRLGVGTIRQSIETPVRPFQHVSIDLFGGLPAVEWFDDHGKETTLDACLTVTDLLTRTVAFVPCNMNITGEGAARLLLETWALKRNVGFPESVLSDRDPRFQSRPFLSAMNAFGIRQRTSTSHSPETNGATEVFHRALKSYLIAYAAHDPRSWPSLIPYVEAALNNAVNSSTGFAPSQLVLAYTPGYSGNFGTARSETEVSAVSAVADTIFRRHTLALDEARDALNKARDDYVCASTPSLPPLILKKDDKVWVDTSVLVPVGVGSPPHKIKPRFVGPFLVLNKVSNTAYRIEIPHNCKAHDVISVKFLKKFHESPAEFEGRPHPPTIPLSALEPGTFEVEKIVSHEKRKRRWFFRVKWMRFGEEECTTEPLACFCDARGNVITGPLRDYIRANNLPIAL